VSERDVLRQRVEQAVGSLFIIEDEIGRGGMAVVYRALDVRLRRKVALKVLPPELAFREDVKNRFLREAQMAAQLSHPNIVPIYAVDEHAGVVYFAMGLVEGETLAQVLHAGPRPDVDTVRRVLREVADALAYAHSRQVVHRDVKPDNILIDRQSGRAVVTDFGIARAAEGDQRLTHTGIAVGTPAYMSPEQAMGEREVDGRADIYALGVVGWQMLAGELPFQANNTPAMLMKHISERPRPLSELRPDLPPNLVYAIERAMSKGRGERWPDALAFRDALAADAPAGPAMRDPSAAARAAEPGRDAAFDPAAYGADLGLRIADQTLSKIGLVPPGSLHPGGGGAPPLPEFPRAPALPPNWLFKADTREYGREALREWRDQQRLWKERVREQRQAMREDGRDLLVGVSIGGGRMRRRELREQEELGMSVEDRIRRVQRSIVGTLTTLTFLGVINAVVTPHFPWVLFPALGMTIGVFARVGRLWVDGIPIGKLFTRQPWQARDRGAAPLAAPSSAVSLRLPPPDLRGVPREVLDGPYGGAVREAAEAKVIIADVLAKLTPADRQMLPEIQPTVDSLVERITSLAQDLHHLDADASPAAIAALERRIAEAKPSAGSPSGERRLQLLDRQLATLKDLAGRRAKSAEQLESASLVLQTMKLDLLKLRSSGFDTRLDASTGATQEARALSSDIGRVIDAANEVRKL